MRLVWTSLQVIRSCFRRHRFKPLLPLGEVGLSGQGEGVLVECIAIRMTPSRPLPWAVENALECAVTVVWGIRRHYARPAHRRRLQIANFSMQIAKCLKNGHFSINATKFCALEFRTNAFSCSYSAIGGTRTPTRSVCGFEYHFIEYDYDF